MGQDGSYVDIPGGSTVYLYYNGTDIEGWTKQQFCAILWDYVEENVDLPAGLEKQTLFEAFTDYFGGIEREYQGGVPDPECAEIVAQCIDSRFERVELTDLLHDAIRDSFEADDWLFNCEYCGTEFRPYFRMEPYVCSDDDCSEKQKADRHGLTQHELREYHQLLDAAIDGDINKETAHNYLEEHADE